MEGICFCFFVQWRNQEYITVKVLTPQQNFVFYQEADFRHLRISRGVPSRACEGWGVDVGVGCGSCDTPHFFQKWSVN